jgi:peptide/nickel transport system substrate-binding protein
MLAACGGETIAPAGEGTDATPAAGAVSDVSPEVEVADVPRESTLRLMFGGTDGQFTDTGLGNPYATGATHQLGNAALWEPLYYYSAFANEHIPWLATGYEYNDDYTELTIFIRDGVEWSDGTPFTANDVAFTLMMLKENAPLLRNSTEIDAWIEEAVAVDDATVRITFFDPRPRFMFTHLSFKFDTGVYIVPQHIYQDVEDVQGFEFYDPEQGWPLCTGPYQIVAWTPSQKFIDRRDDWWGAKTGFAELPAVERILMLPSSGEERAAQLAINNEMDATLGFRATTIPQVVNGNPDIITHSGRELPYGYIDWWPTSLWFNCAVPPFDSPDVRWAVSYTINRQQMLDVGLEGSGILTQLPFPAYPPLQPYFDAAASLLEQYPTNEHNLDTAAARMQAAGYEQDADGFWTQDGERVQALIHGFPIFNDIGPILAEQLRRGGFEADYATPADSGTRMADGTAKIMLFGHGGSITDPFHTLDMYTSKHYQPVGEPAAYYSRWQNEEYDAVMEEMAATAPDPDDPAYMDLYLAAMGIWLENLVDCPIMQWLHRIPMNTTYWQGWPTEENPYINGAFWHLTFPLVLYGLEPAA